MELQPYVASYAAQSATAIRQFLDSRALEAVTRIADGPTGTWN